MSDEVRETTSTPSSTEVPPTAGGTEEAMDFSDLITGGPSDSEAPPPQKTEGQPAVPAAEMPGAKEGTPTPPVPSKEETRPAEPAPKEPPTGVTPKVEPAAKETSTPTPTPELKPQPQPVKEPTLEDYRRHREETIETIAKNYTFTEEDAAKLSTEPEKVLPRVAAKLFVDVYEALSQLVFSQLPSHIDHVSTLREARVKAEDSFFKEWPKLNSAEHRPLIARVGQVWRQLNPRGTPEAFIKEVGFQVSAMLGQFVAPPVVTSNPPVKPVPQAAAQPFRPAAPGSSGPGRPAEGEKNPFDLMIEEFAALDRSG